jgi:hypothetical protein
VPGEAEASGLGSGDEAELSLGDPGRTGIEVIVHQAIVDTPSDNSRLRVQ